MTDLAAEISALRREVERLKAHESIQQQMTRYARGQEWRDETLMDEVFWPDAEVDFGFFKGIWDDYRPILMNIQRQGAGYHFLGPAQIALTSETSAEVECYGLAGGPRDDGAQLYGGRYFMRFARRGDLWRCDRCAYVMDWALKGVAEVDLGAAISGVNSIRERSTAHPWFRRLGQDQTG